MLWLTSAASEFGIHSQATCHSTPNSSRYGKAEHGKYSIARWPMGPWFISLLASHYIRCCFAGSVAYTRNFKEFIFYQCFTFRRKRSDKQVRHTAPSLTVAHDIDHFSAVVEKWLFINLIIINFRRDKVWSWRKVRRGAITKQGTRHLNYTVACRWSIQIMEVWRLSWGRNLVM